MAIIRRNEFKQLNIQSAEEKMKELRKELMKVNSQIAMGTMPENPGRVKEIKKTIAKLIIFIKYKKSNKNVEEVSKKHE